MVTNNERFIFPSGGQLTKDELYGFIGYNEQTLAPRYRKNMQYYLGKHDIETAIIDKADNIDNRLIDNKIKPLVDSYNGFFIGIPPTVNAEQKNVNDTLNDWNSKNSFQDELNEVSKQTDIYGRSLMFIYQGEDAQPHIRHFSPEHAFIIYDNTIEHKPLAFVSYEVDTAQSYSQAKGIIQYADKLYKFDETGIFEDIEINQYAQNPYGLVPAVEFFENEERQGVFEQIVTLQDELDWVMSQKANQIAYFDNAYMYMFQIHLPEDENGNPIFDFEKNRMIYAPDVDPDSNPEIGFAQKPDADNMQENMINHLQKSIYENTGIANLRDENFAGNSSGVAMQYKLLSMKNKADNKERKFDKALKQLYRIVFQTLFNSSSEQEAWTTLTFHFTRNLPDDVASLVSTAKDAEGLVSKRTQLSLLPFVKDPQAEIDQMNKEKEDNIKMAQSAVGSLPDYMKSDDKEEDEDADNE